MTDDTQAREVSRMWADAERAADADVLDTLLTDDFLAVGPLGFVLTKEQWTDRFRTGDFVHHAFSWEDVGVRHYGDAAVAVGVQEQDSAYRGRPMKGRFRVSQTLVRRGEDWLIAGIHISPIAPPPGSAEGK